VADFVGADRALKSLSLTRVEQIDLIPPPLVRAGEPVERVRARIERGELVPVADHLLVADEDDRPLDWLPVARLETLDEIPPAEPGGADPMIDHVTTLRDALSALFEANAAYGAVVDEHDRCVGLVGAAEIAAGLRQAGTPSPGRGHSHAPATLGGSRTTGADG
jgi:osmoprotectant transport system ATP-binding protein